MKTDLNTLLVTLYVHLDDRILPAIGFTRDRSPGRKPVLNDVELLCLLVAQHLLGIASDRKWIRYARAHLRGMFPGIPKQSGWGKRVRQSTGLLSAVITELARDTPTFGEITRLVDSTPLPCGKSRETVKRSDLADDAGYGYCASHSRFFWGFPLYLVCTPDGMPVIWGLANPKIGEREVTEALLRQDRHLIQPGQVIVGDKGFAGKEFEAFVTDDLGAHLIRPDRKDETPRFGKLGGIRQWVESVFDTLKGQLTLEDHGGRTIAGVYSRVAARLLALAASIWHNWLIDAPIKRSLIAYDH
ncbi:IS982 family transposase [Microbacterium pseudoresistens]|uniref:Transposase IS4-like domain-containing protein n=1 Tax=Microbacterium pseudoresistens TaxID=640634 RepID=A0A7Y9JLH6_9MICO|nr:hypothetical protein [Microbacterium pseudoresistens]